VTFRARLTIVAAAAVALAVVFASALVFVVVRGQLLGQVDHALAQRADEIAHMQLRRIETDDGEYLDIPESHFGGPGGYVQVVRTAGAPLRAPGETVTLPVSKRTRKVAAGGVDAYFSNAHVDGTHVRVLTFPLAPGYAAQVFRPLTEVDDALARIRTLLVLVAIGGIAVAVALGLLVSRAAVAPVKRLTLATERVTETGDLSERIESRGHDELSRLAGSFNTMLGALDGSTRALEESVARQRQLVADASHELRTPLTSIRTNVEVLLGGRELPPGERTQLLADVVDQIGELTTLIGELIELARGDRGHVEPEDVRLDVLAATAVERTRRAYPAVAFETDLDESLVVGVPASLERAIGNLLDNAAKWTGPGGLVEVTTAGGQVVVRDHGPGIDDGDLPFVFDRFYRSREARTLPGSGLGLAIVRQVADAHGGEIVAERAEGGGTRMTLRLPRVAVPAAAARTAERVS
jgi:two-component system, OmpR family, sensor histidine kinase MprB